MPDGLRPSHSRPQLRRRDWVPLDGEWRFALDPDARWRRPDDVTWGRTIRMPFAPETTASGVGETGFYKACWYGRVVEIAPPERGERLLLHFGVVDYEAAVWAGGQLVARHEGGSTPFTADVVERDLPQWLRYYLDCGGPPDRITASTDASANPPRSLLDQVRSCVRDHEFTLEQVLPVATADTARVLKLATKGRLAAGADADRLVPERGSLELLDVVAGGRPAKPDPALADSDRDPAVCQ